MIQGLHGFILNWTILNFLDFYEKGLCKKKKVCKNCLDKQENPVKIKNVPEKT